MLPIGNQTTCWATPTEPFEYAVANDFDAFEWFPDKKPGVGWDDADLSASCRRAIRETARTRGIRLSVHARWQANPLEPDSLPLFLKDIELAKDLGAVLLNVHLCHEAGLAAYVTAMVPLLKHTSDAGLQLAIENTPQHGPELFNELFGRLRALKSVPTGHVGMCLDLGHANLCAATRNNYLGFVEQLDPKLPIIHLHLHENWGDADSHLPLFTGPAARDDSGIRGLLVQMQRRRFAGAMILEQWPTPPTLLNQARDKLLALCAAASWQPKNATEAPATGIGAQSVGSTRLAVSPHSGQEFCDTPSGPVACQGSSSPRPSPPKEERETPLERNAVAFSTPEARALATPEPAPPQDLVSELVAADHRSRSWREKLAAVRAILVESPQPLTAEQLAAVAVYLRFLAAGEVACAEDGRHFRPGHHAEIALDIQKSLAAAITPENAFVVRKIQQSLPSSAQTFRRAEPLTRIRDIAHRNDIPQELKREIKDTLQNKLHRCAGPEDLATSAALLQRITAPGAGYPPAFVEQFRIFHDELEEFFNARSLDQRLGALLPVADAPLKALLQEFLKLKAAAAGPFATLEKLTELRRRLADAVQTRPGAESQEFLLADLGLEDFAFVLLSELLNSPEPLNLNPNLNLNLLRLSITNLSLSGVSLDECRAMENELLAWQKTFSPTEREQLLRLNATIERARRLAEDFTDRVMSLFPRAAERVGRELGVAEHAIRVFGEAEVRNHLSFQLSKLASISLRQLRESLGLPGWDVLVGGHAAGRLTAVSSLAEFGIGLAEPTIALLKRAEGDEEIPTGVLAVVVAHEIPHLSHLGVRARQAGVIFIACEERSKFEELSALQGRWLRLNASSETVEWEPLPEPTESTRRLGVRQSSGAFERVTAFESARGLAHSKTLSRVSEQIRHTLPPVQLDPPHPWIPLAEARFELGGGKAEGARRLADVARQKGAGFAVPPSLVVPFGVMEAALRAAPALEAEYRASLARLNRSSASDAAAASESLAGLSLQLRVPPELVSAVAKPFSPTDRLMVRSSSNVEDLEELAGAGLYESIANVAPSDIESAVRMVWASLWTRRAFLSRSQAGIAHEQAHMAVLIQRMLAPDFSFVLHTTNPLNHNAGEVYGEIAVGLGETLVSGAARGTPYRFVCDKVSGAVTLLAFASFSRALAPAAQGGVTFRIVDYSQVDLSRAPATAKSLAKRLAQVGGVVEKAFQKPLDVEGAVVGNEIYLVQARPQQGLLLGAPASPPASF